jgi:hypothetical protein
MVSCLAADDPESAPGGEPVDEAVLFPVAEPPNAEEDGACPHERPVQLRYSIVPEAIDLDLCDALDERQGRCFEGCDGTLDRDLCSQRHACSRQLWQKDLVDDVYACIAERPCGDVDPTTSCLVEVASRGEPSAARARFEEARGELEAECGPMIDAAPGQRDDVYELLTGCIEDNDGCDAVAACTIMTLEVLVDEACGSAETA